MVQASHKDATWVSPSGGVLVMSSWEKYKWQTENWVKRLYLYYLWKQYQQDKICLFCLLFTFKQSIQTFEYIVFLLPVTMQNQEIKLWLKELVCTITLQFFCINICLQKYLSERFDYHFRFHSFIYFKFSYS